MREAAVILAAGKGTRMKSELPKVCHRAGGKTLVEWVVEACREAGIETIVVIVGYKAEAVREALAGRPVTFATQAEQLGTGHAAMQAREAVGEEPTRLFVLNGDSPLIDAEVLRAMRAAHVDNDAQATLLTVVPDEPLEYGRVIRDAESGWVVDVVEERDCTPEQKAIRELNAGFYVFEAPAVWRVLAGLGSDNKAGEYYITDVARKWAQEGGRVVAVQAPAEMAQGVNTPEQLAVVDRLLLQRVQARR